MQKASQVWSGMRRRIGEAERDERRSSFRVLPRAAIVGNAPPPQPQREPPRPAIEPGQANARVGQPRPHDGRPLAGHDALLAARQEHAEAALGVEHVRRVGDPDRHARAILLRDLAQPRRALEGAGESLADLEPDGARLRYHVEHRAERVGPVLLTQRAAEPEAAIGAADPRPPLVDRATAAGALVHARSAAELAQLVDPEHGAAQRARAALARRRHAKRFSAKTAIIDTTSASFAAPPSSMPIQVATPTRPARARFPRAVNSPITAPANGPIRRPGRAKKIPTTAPSAAPITARRCAPARLAPSALATNSAAVAISASSAITISVPRPT